MWHQKGGEIMPITQRLLTRAQHNTIEKRTTVIRESYLELHKNPDMLERWESEILNDCVTLANELIDIFC